MRGPGRAVVGLLMAAAGGVLAWSGVRALDRRAADAAGELPGVGRRPAGHRRRQRGLAGARGRRRACSASRAGLLAVLRGRTWPAMGRRYERPGAAAPGAGAAAAAGDRRGPRPGAWKALDRGDDPTDRDTGARPADRPIAEPAGRCPAPRPGGSARRL